MGYLGAWGEIIHEKNLKSKILWHYPFNYVMTMGDDYYLVQKYFLIQ
jgi:hypothetical protein